MKAILPLIFFFSLNAFAQSFVGTFVVVKGDVKILRPPTANDPGPFAQLEGVKYSYEDAKIGKKVNPGEIVQSGADGKAKIAYPNGDTFLVGNASSLVMPNIKEKDSDNTSAIKLIYGRVRSLISKRGPRNNMRVTTPDAVAGVRGTDFFVRANPDVGTQLTVLRGEVAVQSLNDPTAPVSVKTGFMTQADHKQSVPLKATEATKEELTALQIESALRATEADLSPLTPEIKKEVVDLNEKSKQALLDDIKIGDPAMSREIKKKKMISDDDINDAVVAKLYKMAPSAVKKKPTKAEVDGLGKDVYDKYYKKDDQKP